MGLFGTKQTANTQQMLTRKEVCELLHVSRNVFYSLIKKGLLTAIDVNKGTKKRKVYRVTKSSLDKYLSDVL